MKKKILVILVCMLMMLVTSLVVAGQTIEMNQQEKVLPKDILQIDKACEFPVSYQFLEEYDIDAEQYVWDEKNKEWVDADSGDEALDIPSYSDVTFKIVIHNNGNEPLSYIIVTDTLADSLRFISGEPEPDYIDDSYPPFWILWWIFPGPLNPCETIEVYITALEEGAECSYDYSFLAVDCDQNVQDGDYAWIHATPKSRTLNSLILNILQNHPNKFPIIQKLLLLIK